MRDLFTSIILLVMIGIWQILTIVREIIHRLSRLLISIPRGKPGR